MRLPQPAPPIPLPLRALTGEVTISPPLRIESKPDQNMPRSATYGRLWSGRRKTGSSSSYSDEDRTPRDYDFFGSSDLSEPETETEYTPETEDDFDKSGARDYRFEVSGTAGDSGG